MPSPIKQIFPRPDNQDAPPRATVAVNTKTGVATGFEALDHVTQIHVAQATLGLAPFVVGRDGDDRLASLPLLAAPVDFTEAGPLKLFIDDAVVTLIEDMMDAQGFLTSDLMADAFDLMHAEYLRQLFLHNDLAEGHGHVGGKAIALTDITVPLFVVGTEDDHVAPWQTVDKMHLVADTDVTFTPTSGGHNAGIVSEPGHHDRHFRTGHTAEGAVFRNPGAWLADHTAQDGSWWPVLTGWLTVRSGKDVAPPPLGKPEGRYKVQAKAPGAYVMQA